MSEPKQVGLDYAQIHMLKVGMGSLCLFMSTWFFGRFGCFFFPSPLPFYYKNTSITLQISENLGNNLDYKTE